MPTATVQRQARALAAATVCATLAASEPSLGAEFSAGGFSFSDELGGFRLLSASGSGRPDDPIVLAEEIFDVQPVTLVIRNLSLVAGRPLQTQVVLVKRVVNGSNRVWAAFELELQEIRKKPSVYSDGLSFKQFAASPPDAGSDSFAQNERNFEPYDRIEFLGGHVDPEATAEFRVTITDATPVAEFYLVQDPKLLAAELPRSGSSLAALKP